MNIKWKTRLTNKTFWIAIVSTIVLLTQQLGLNIFPTNWESILNTILYVLVLLGVIIDPSTSGISDKVISTITEESINEATKVKTESNTTSINNTVSENSQNGSVEGSNVNE